jgi:integrase
MAVSARVTGHDDDGEDHQGSTRAGVREVRFHDLRHSFGTRMAGVGVPMRTLQEWLGHRDFATTLIYADYSPSEQEREWVAAAFARGGLVPPGVPLPEMQRVRTDDESHA